MTAATPSAEELYARIVAVFGEYYDPVLSPWDELTEDQQDLWETALDETRWQMSRSGVKF